MSVLCFAVWSVDVNREAESTTGCFPNERVLRGERDQKLFGRGKEFDVNGYRDRAKSFVTYESCERLESIRCVLNVMARYLLEMTRREEQRATHAHRRILTVANAEI